MNTQKHSEVEVTKHYSDLQLSRIARDERVFKVRFRKPRVVHTILTPEGGAIVVSAHGNDGQPEHWFFNHFDADGKGLGSRDGYFYEGECMAGIVRYLLERGLK